MLKQLIKAILGPLLVILTTVPSHNPTLPEKNHSPLIKTEIIFLEKDKVTNDEEITLVSKNISEAKEEEISSPNTYHKNRISNLESRDEEFPFDNFDDSNLEEGIEQKPYQDKHTRADSEDEDIEPPTLLGSPDEPSEPNYPPDTASSLISSDESGLDIINKDSVVNSIVANPEAVVSEQNSPFGLNGPVLRDPFSKWSEYIDILKDLGVTWVRKGGYDPLIDVQLLKPYNWEAVDQQIKTLQENNIQPFPFFKIHKLPGLKLYEDFVVAAVERYDGDGIEDMPGLLKAIKYWMTTPEPDHPNLQYWEGSAEEYAELVASTIKAAKAADPDAKIILAGTYGDIRSYQPSGFFDKVFKELQNLNNPNIDIIDFHLFDLKGDYKKIKDFINLLNELCNIYGYDKLPIWITETSTFSGEVMVGAQKIKQTESEQAEELVKRYIYGLAQGIEKIFWDGPLSKTDDDNYFGQVGLRDINNLPRLSYFSYKLMVERLKNVDFKNIEILKDGSDGLYLFKFTPLENDSLTGFIKDKKPIYVAWFDMQEENNSKLPLLELKSIPVSDKKSTKKVERIGPSRKTNETQVLELSSIITPYVKITSSVPQREEGRTLNEKAYPCFIKTQVLALEEGQKLNLTVTQIPLYIEEQEEPPEEIGKGIFQLLHLKELREAPLVNSDVDFIEGTRVLFNWADIEDEDDNFRWDELDNFIKDWSGQGKRVILGVQTASEGSESDYDDGTVNLTPEWVFDKGADYLIEIDKKERKRIWPDYWDERYLGALRDFVEEFALRFKDNPYIEYIEIGIGRAGSTQLGNKKVVEGDDDVLDKEGKKTSYRQKAEEQGKDLYVLWTETVKKIIDIYVESFKDKKKLAIRLASFRFPPEGSGVIENSGIERSEDEEELYEIAEYAANHGVYLLANTLDGDPYKFLNKRPFPEIFNKYHDKTKTGLWSDFILFNEKDEELDEENFAKAMENALGDIKQYSESQDTLISIPKTYISYSYLHSKEIEDIENQDYPQLDVAISSLEIRLE